MKSQRNCFSVSPPAKLIYYENYLLQILDIHMIQLIVCILSSILVACAVAVPCAHSYNSKKSTFGKECVALPEDARSLSTSFRLENATEPYRSRSMKEFEVLRMYNDMDNGYYVDLGANHWDGILIQIHSCLITSTNGMEYAWNLTQLLQLGYFPIEGAR